MHATIPDSRCLSVDWWDLPEVRIVVLEMFGAREGHHATPSELSVVRRFYPRSVIDLPQMERFEPVPEPVTWTAEDFRQRYPDGRVWFTVILIELRDGKVLRETQYWAEPFDPPDWRAAWVERT